MKNNDRKRILLVDNSVSALEQLKLDLEKYYEVVTARSGPAAVDILEEPVKSDILFSNQFDLIVTDMKMRGMNGLELAQYVRRRNRNNKYTPVILLTVEKFSKNEARKHGCVAYFSKADKPRLIGMIRSMLG